MNDSMVSNAVFDFSPGDYLENSQNSFKDAGDMTLPANQISTKAPESEQLEICQQTVNPHCKVSMDDFQILKCIGRGGYGKVYLVRKISDGRHTSRLFAMKVLKKAVICRTQKDMVHTWAERNILEMIRHPFLVKLYYAFQNESNLNLILEYCSGGELFTYLESVGFVSEKKASFYIAEITLAIGHLHSIGIIYRDLKPENILLDREGHCKLTDFGLSKEKCDRTNTYCGTKEYMAPEIWLRKYHDKNVDWWSLGNLLYDMLAGYPPFSSEDKSLLREKILKDRVIYPESFSEEAVSFLEGLLQKDPNLRLGSGSKDVEAIKQHLFFKRYHIRWTDVLERRMEPPYKPALASETDTSQFDPNFTSLAPMLSPVDPVSQDLFKGFSYVSSGVAESFLDNGNRHTYESRFSRRRTPSAASESSYASDGSEDLPGAAPVVTSPTTHFRMSPVFTTSMVTTTSSVYNVGTSGPYFVKAEDFSEYSLQHRFMRQMSLQPQRGSMEPQLSTDNNISRVDTSSTLCGGDSSTSLHQHNCCEPASSGSCWYGSNSTATRYFDATARHGLWWGPSQHQS